MAMPLRIFFIIIIVAYFAIIFYYLIKKKMNIQYTLGWLGLGIVMLIIAVFPNIITFFAKLLDIQDETNLVFLIESTIVLLILISITSIISRQNESSRRLSQEMAILEKRLRDLEKKDSVKINDSGSDNSEGNARGAKTSENSQKMENRAC